MAQIQGQETEFTKSFRLAVRLIIDAVIAIAIAGFVRIYYGSPITFKLTVKDNFGFKDSIVNLADILGQQRSLVAREHPQVKKQLEEAGIIETDEQAKHRRPKATPEEDVIRINYGS